MGKSAIIRRDKLINIYDQQKEPAFIFCFSRSGFDDYLNKARQNYVIADPAQRKKLILEEAQMAASEVGGKIFYTEDLLNTVSFIVEYPVIVRGSFDKDYLKIPKEVLTTTMISHQKYFPVINDKGKLLPYFIAVSNTKARDLAIVARGNERGGILRPHRLLAWHMLANSKRDSVGGWDDLPMHDGTWIQGYPTALSLRETCL